MFHFEKVGFTSKTFWTTHIPLFRHSSFGPIWCDFAVRSIIYDTSYIPPVWSSIVFKIWLEVQQIQLKTRTLASWFYCVQREELQCLELSDYCCKTEDIEQCSQLMQSTVQMTTKTLRRCFRSSNHSPDLIIRPPESHCSRWYVNVFWQKTKPPLTKSIHKLQYLHTDFIIQTSCLYLQ